MNGHAETHNTLARSQTGFIGLKGPMIVIEQIAHTAQGGTTRVTALLQKPG